WPHVRSAKRLLPRDAAFPRLAEPPGISVDTPSPRRTVRNDDHRQVRDRPVNRRTFFKTTGASAIFAATGEATAQPARSTATIGDRETWVGVARRLADPILTNLAQGTLKARMPVEQAASTDRRSVTHLEALGRLLAGISPWLELPGD